MEEHTTPELLVTADPQRIIDLVVSGKRILVQTFQRVDSILEAASLYSLGKTREEVLATGLSPGAIAKLVMGKVYANGGSMHLGERRHTPDVLLDQYKELHQRLPDIMVFYVPESTVKIARDLKPELMELYLDKGPDTDRQSQEEDEIWATATHQAPSTAQ